jgi:nitrogen fixation protein FixH
MNATASLPKPAFNPWPYALIAFFTILVSVIAGFVTWSLRQDMELVSADYYDQEMRFQQRINSVNRTQSLGAKVAIAYDSGILRVSLPVEHGAQHATGTLELYRPSNARLDRKLALQPSLDGHQFIEAKGLQPGLWKARISWMVGKDSFFRDESLVIP